MSECIACEYWFKNSPFSLVGICGKTEKITSINDTCDKFTVFKEVGNDTGKSSNVAKDVEED